MKILKEIVKERTVVLEDFYHRCTDCNEVARTDEYDFYVKKCGCDGKWKATWEKNTFVWNFIPNAPMPIYKVTVTDTSINGRLERLEKEVRRIIERMRI